MDGVNNPPSLVRGEAAMEEGWKRAVHRSMAAAEVVRRSRNGDRLSRGLELGASRKEGLSRNDGLETDVRERQYGDCVALRMQLSLVRERGGAGEAHLRMAVRPAGQAVARAGNGQRRPRCPGQNAEDVEEVCL